MHFKRLFGSESLVNDVYEMSLDGKRMITWCKFITFNLFKNGSQNETKPTNVKQLIFFTIKKERVIKRVCKFDVTLIRTFSVCVEMCWYIEWFVVWGEARVWVFWVSVRIHWSLKIYHTSLLWLLSVGADSSIGLRMCKVNTLRLRNSSRTNKYWY